MESSRQLFLVHSLNSFRRGARPCTPTSPGAPVHLAASPTRAQAIPAVRRVMSVKIRGTSGLVSTATAGKQTSPEASPNHGSAPKIPRVVHTSVNKILKKPMEPVVAVRTPVTSLPRIEKQPIVRTQAKAADTNPKQYPVQFKAARQLPTPPSTPPLEAVPQVRKVSNAKTRTVAVLAVTPTKETTIPPVIARTGIKVLDKGAARRSSIFAPGSITKTAPKLSVTKKIQKSTKKVSLPPRRPTAVNNAKFQTRRKLHTPVKSNTPSKSATPTKFYTPKLHTPISHERPQKYLSTPKKIIHTHTSVLSPAKDIETSISVSSSLPALVSVLVREVKRQNTPNAYKSTIESASLEETAQKKFSPLSDFVNTTPEPKNHRIFIKDTDSAALVSASPNICLIQRPSTRPHTNHIVEVSESAPKTKHNSITSSPASSESQRETDAANTRSSTVRQQSINDRLPKPCTYGVESNTHEGRNRSEQKIATSSIQTRIAAMFASAGVKPPPAYRSGARVCKVKTPELLEGERASKDEKIQREVDALRRMKRVDNASKIIVKTAAFGGDEPSNVPTGPDGKLSLGGMAILYRVRQERE